MKISITGSPSTVSVSSTSRTPSPSTTVSAMGLAHGISETYSRKVFVGGLPPDIDEGDIFVILIVGINKPLCIDVCLKIYYIFKSGM